MSTYAFDIDGTLPQIKTLANDLYDAGHQIIVITGGLRKVGEGHKLGTRTLDRKKQLRKRR